jgi:hypothetical protein
MTIRHRLLTAAWAASQGIPLQIQYTLPVEQYGA